MPQYVLAAAEQGKELEAMAERLAAAARIDVQRATNYVLGVVLFAIVLFFAGIGMKLGSPHLRRILLGVGMAVFVTAAAWIATFPVSLSI